MTTTSKLAAIAITAVMAGCSKNPGTYEVAAASAAKQTVDLDTLRTSADALWEERLDKTA